MEEQPEGRKAGRMVRECAGQGIRMMVKKTGGTRKGRRPAWETRVRTESEPDRRRSPRGGQSHTGTGVHRTGDVYSDLESERGLSDDRGTVEGAVTGVVRRVSGDG